MESSRYLKQYVEKVGGWDNWAQAHPWVTYLVELPREVLYGREFVFTKREAKQIEGSHYNEKPSQINIQNVWCVITQEVRPLTVNGLAVGEPVMVCETPCPQDGCNAHLVHQPGVLKAVFNDLDQAEAALYSTEPTMPIYVVGYY
jgi:hypothetical protein